MGTFNNARVEDLLEHVATERGSHVVSRSSEIQDMNEAKCRRCRGVGKLICCDGCPAAYHMTCAGIYDVGGDSDEQWFCPGCERELKGRRKREQQRAQMAQLYGSGGGGGGSRGRKRSRR